MGYFCFSKIVMVMVCFHIVGMLLEIQILLYISRRYFKDIVGSYLILSLVAFDPQLFNV